MKSESRVGETERMTIEKFYWPMGLGPDKQEDTKSNKAKEFFVRNSEASALEARREAPPKA